MAKVEQYRTYIENLLKEYSRYKPSYGDIEVQQQGKQQQTKKLLLRQLRLKFTALPETVRQRVESTDNLELLENWLTQVTLANSLAETELGKALA